MLTWSARQVQWNRSKEVTVQAFDMLRKRLPFAMTGAHPDTGEEFINDFLYAYCRNHGITYVEERNKNVVRHYLGDWRFGMIEIVDAMNGLYTVLNLYLNHFIAVRRTVHKRFDQKTKTLRCIHESATSYARVLTHPDIPGDAKKCLREEHEKLDILPCKREVNRLIERIFAI